MNCRICNAEAHWIPLHLSQRHMGEDLQSYLEKYPGADTMSETLYDKIKGITRVAPKIEGIKVKLGSLKIPVNVDVPESACLPLPNEYRVPENGKLAVDIESAAISFAKGRSIYIWGLPGTGKDAFFHAASFWTRKPGLLFQVQPSADIQAWFFSHEFSKDGTFWQEGVLLKALRDGYVSPISGRRIPYVILITDFDRATKEQAESMRLILDSIEGRVIGPNGVMYSVLPGTQIVVTANSSGGGDSRGRCISSNVIDASILDRFERAYEFHFMDKVDEEVILRAKFKKLETIPKIFTEILNAAESIRTAIEQDRVYAEFSHRALCAILGHAEDLLEYQGRDPKLLLKAFRVYLDKLPDKDTRKQVEALISPHLSGGAIR